MERELKRKVGDDPCCKRVARPETLRSIYFDTDRGDLRKAGILLRVRHAGGRRIQTIKRVTGPGAGMFDRAEWESEIAGDQPDWGMAGDTALALLLSKKSRSAIKPVFETVVERTVYALGSRGWTVELALDQGHVAAMQRKAPIAEAELELKVGAPARLFTLAQHLRKLVPLRLGIESKADRGYNLIENKPIAAVKADRIRLPPDATAAEAFATVARSCLHHLLANEPALQHNDAEAVHQMRVATRRLRAAISLFSQVVDDRETDDVKDALKWMAAQLAPARDLDVFVNEASTPAQMPNIPLVGLRDLQAELARRRDRALERAKAIANSPKFHDLVFEIAGWVEAGAWMTTHSAAASERRQQGVEQIATRELTRRRRKIKKRGKDLHRLDVGRRHKLRIQAKKVRYATDFFATVFPGKKPARRRKRFIASLKRMQDALGYLNDVTVREPISFAIARANGRHGVAAVARRRAFAAGLVTGEEEARVKPLLDVAADAYREFRKAKPFWR